jgi:thioredoxin
MATIHLKKEDFIRKVANYEANQDSFKFLGDKPAIIDFYAEWCGPCRMLSPKFEEISNLYAGKVDVYKINVDEEEELASLFDIRSIPTLVFITKDGKMQRTQGALGTAQLKEAIEKILFG